MEAQEVSGASFCTVAIVLLFVSPAFADFSGRVVGVTDGATIKVMHKGKEEKIRLYGIDCPEKGQPFGRKAKEFTSAMVFGKTVAVYVRGFDKYGRTIGDVILPGRRVLNQELVAAGLAWWYKKYAPRDDTLRVLEEQARTKKLGLWADPNPVPPWCWRKGQKKAAC